MTDFQTKVDGERCRRDLGMFARASWPHCESARWIDNWHIDYLCEILTALYRREIKRAVINMPPRYGKSFIAQKAFPAWVWANDPGAKFVFASHSEDLAISLSLERRTLIESDWYQERYGDRVRIAPGKNEGWYYRSTAHGSMQAVGVGTNLTGWGGDYLFWDDPISAKDRFSKSVLRRTRDFLEHTWESRLNDKINGVMLGIMQRLGMSDPTAYVQELGWEVFELQGLAERRTTVVFPLRHEAEKRDPALLYDSEGRRVVIREPDTALWEAREPVADLKKKRDKQPEYFSTQYQQRPRRDGGGVIKDEWIKHWHELPSRFDQMIQTWDCTFTDTSRADYVVGQVWGRIGPDKYLIDQWRRRAGLMLTVQAVRNFRAKHPGARATYIERKANGFGVIEQLKRKLPNIIPYDPDRDKLSRLVAVEEEFAGGNVYFPAHGVKFPWVREFVTRVTGFIGSGTVDFDDEIDCMTCALCHLRRAVTTSHGMPEGIGRGQFVISDASLNSTFERHLPFDEGESNVERNPFAY